MMNDATMPLETANVNLVSLEAIAETAREAIRAYSTNDKTEQFSKQAKQAAVITYGRALLAGRALHSSDKAFGKWVKERNLDAALYAAQGVRNDAMAVARAAQEFDSWVACSAANPTGMRVWAYKTGLIKPKPKPQRPTITLSTSPQTPSKTIQQLKREAAIAAGETVPPLPLDQETKDRIDEDVKKRADALELADADRKKFEKVMRDALRRVVQEGRSYKEKCNVEQRKIIEIEVERRINLMLPNRQKELDEAKQIRQRYEELFGNRKPIFTIEEFRTILKALHVDTASKETAAAAFHVFNSQKFRLTGIR